MTQLLLLIVNRMIDLSNNQEGVDHSGSREFSLGTGLDQVTQ